MEKQLKTRYSKRLVKIADDDKNLIYNKEYFFNYQYAIKIEMNQHQFLNKIKKERKINGVNIVIKSILENEIANENDINFRKVKNLKEQSKLFIFQVNEETHFKIEALAFKYNIPSSKIVKILLNNHFSKIKEV